MENNLNILFIENSQSDTLLIIQLLALDGYIINYLRIETSEQMNFLRACGGNLVQGYYVARPMPFAACTEWIQRESTGP